MPASRRDSKAIRTHRRENSSPISDASSSIDDCTTPTTSSNGLFTEEQLKLRAMIPAITPAHGPDSTSTAILSALSLGSHRPNSHTRRKSDGHVNRPPNAFIVFRRAQVQNMPANVTQHQQRISNLTALFWRVLTHSEQKTWFALADDIKKLHGILFPDYNFNPRNPDGSKKPMLPRAGITPERLDYAWNEAQLLIQRHTVLIDHPPAPPASCSGKLPRPKAPRKGQGTRAKERREREAAERAAAAVAATAQEAAASNGDQDDLIYSTGHLNVNSLDNRAYFAPIEEEPAVTPPSDAAIAWRPDFSLEGSVSSRSSPSNSWSELVSGSEANNELVDPLDTSYTSGCYDANTAINGPTIVEEYNFGHFVGSFPSFTGNSPQVHAETTSISHAYSDLSLAPPPIAQKRDDAFGSAPKYATISTNGPVTTYASYYDHHHHHHGALHSSAAANAVMAPTTEFATHQTEAQYIFHDIDPTTTYLTNVDGFAPVAPANYVW